MPTSRSYEERHQTAEAVMLRMQGGNVDPERAGRAMYRRLGALGSFAVDYVMGDLWSRPQLAPRDRSLVVVAILTWLGKERELAFHIPGALNHGLSREEVAEIMVQMCVYGGFPRAVEGMRAATEAFARIDAG